jgi:hypothetical protein
MEPGTKLPLSPLDFGSPSRISQFRRNELSSHPQSRLPASEVTKKKAGSCSIENYVKKRMEKVWEMDSRQATP